MTSIPMRSWSPRLPHAGWLGALCAVFAAVALLPLPEFWITQANYIGIYSLAALGLVLLTGVAGMTSFGQAAFVGLGAYTSAVLTTTYGASPWFGLVAALALVVLSATVLGLLTVRLAGHYLPLGTLAWALSLYYLFANLEVLGRFDGISGIAQIRFLDQPLRTGRQSFVLIWLCVGFALLAVVHLLDSRQGRAIRALKGGAAMAESCGVNTARARLLAFVLAALLAGLSGWLYAHLQRAVNPTPFSVNAGIGYLFMAVVGGAGHVAGALVGAAVVTLLGDWLQLVLPRLLGHSGNFEVIVLGVLLVLLLQRAPEGLWPMLVRWCSRVLPRKAEGSGARAAPTSVDGVPLARRQRPPRGDLVLEVRAARKAFGGLVAVDGVSFSLRAGEVLGLIGPNGAGKSTMFNLVSGMLRLSSGEVHFLGQRVDGKPARWLARAGLARTFQHVRLMPAMRVLDNVALGAHLRGRKSWLASVLRMDRAEERALLREAQAQLARVGLAEFAHREAGTLALGQQRLLEIARALAADPDVLLLDEPAAGLRYQEKVALAALLRQLRDEGVSILIVEHDMEFVMGLVDRLVVMKFGSCIAQGSPEAVRNDPRVIEAYLGDAS